ncbi:Ank and TRP 2 domain containing protein [Trichuris trichiura]|uniref:Ank and TRP 2 domain containing protein n=1 Tax=Trichuris trichiura TaxID=36087 RepID=A0A077ZEM3_TRITR|nr:Ank and TRP 2 domain containing protein [Trichuris trichiura]
MLTPLMYALLMKKSLVVRMLAGRTFYRFMDTVMIAIVVDNTFAVDMMYKERPTKISREMPIFFPHYMTPLMLAANYDNYEIVKLLISYGETLEIPHRPDCRCTKCRMLGDGSDCIERSANRLYAYRALCSHAFLLQSEIEDPILYAFLIARDLEKCQESDPDNAVLYAKMSEHVQQLPLALLNCCENAKEVMLMLTQKEGCRTAASSTLARLQLATDTKQKEFVANPRCFEVFQKLWMGNWDQKGNILTFLLLFFVVIGSFALGLNFLIEHYKYNVAVRDGQIVEQPFFMTSIKDALRYLYWAWFGYLDPERLEVIVGNYDPQGYESKHTIIQYAAEFLSALYYIILVVSLLNLMISIMATTAQSAIDNSKTEWQFVCCLLWSEYFGDCRALPPPICLPYLFLKGIIWVAEKLFTNVRASLTSVTFNLKD